LHFSAAVEKFLCVVERFAVDTSHPSRPDFALVEEEALMEGQVYWMLVEEQVYWMFAAEQVCWMLV